MIKLIDNIKKVLEFVEDYLMRVNELNSDGID